ncbi:zinc-finger domain protein [Thermococcus prieurii virus 1]|uniref:zinc-finger domain protein n=1 Tax=Thermococcus prieurii virus 1 TaxID=1115696 RepID=UPI00024FB221|nr:zinc-finger domain protein [Thermococcus prieurii virus 1]AEY69075.1 C2H2-zinc finger protein [Thermococcus prieurii virus 1]AFA44839.1 C2H2 Zn finger protein [Thermococcus prieurii virus 1]
MPECPYCGKWFKTKKGLQQHITKVHKVDTPFGKVLDPSTFDFMGKRRGKGRELEKEDEKERPVQSLLRERKWGSRDLLKKGG